MRAAHASSHHLLSEQAAFILPVKEASVRVVYYSKKQTSPNHSTLRCPTAFCHQHPAAARRKRRLCKATRTVPRRCFRLFTFHDHTGKLENVNQGKS